MASDLEAIHQFAAGKDLGIAISVPKPKADIWLTRTFRLNNAHAKLLAIVLAHHSPIDLLTGQRIDTSKALALINVKEFHHFFPRAYLERKGERQQKINCLANFVMLTAASNKEVSDRPPSDYLRQVAAAADVKLDEWLSSNLAKSASRLPCMMILTASSSCGHELFTRQRGHELGGTKISFSVSPEFSLTNG